MENKENIGYKEENIHRENQFSPKENIFSIINISEISKENFEIIKEDIIGNIKIIFCQLENIANKDENIPLQNEIDTIYKAEKNIVNYCSLFAHNKEKLSTGYILLAETTHKIKAMGRTIITMIEGKEYSQKFTMTIIEKAIKEYKKTIEAISSIKYETNNKTSSMYSPYQIAENLINFFNIECKTNNITVTNKTNPEIIITANKEINTAVLENLISNAIKFTEKGGTISIGVDNETQNKISFYVEDSGIGIPNGVDVFKGGYTTQGSNKTKGTGLGLTICKEYLDQIGGHIEHRPKINGTGTKFIFTLPKIPL